MLRTHFILACLLLLIGRHPYAQSYSFRKYQVENGLSNNATICCLQDNKGFMWFGTKDGLNRFDGYSFKVFQNDPSDSLSIGNNFIHSIYEDDGGTMWVGTERGLYRYNATTESFRLIPMSRDARIRGIQGDRKGNLWFIMGFTLVRYNDHNQRQETYNIPSYFEATSVCTTPDGTVWVSTATGQLNKYSFSTNRFTAYDVFQHSPSPGSRWIEKIYSAANGNILIGTSNQGAKFFEPSFNRYTDILTYNPDKTEVFARNFVQTGDNEFWIATETGVFIYNEQTHQSTNLQKKFNNPYSISDNAVYSFCRDKEGGIWVTTYFGGINYFPKQHTPFEKMFPVVNENSLSGNVIREIHQDNDGNIWIGTEDAGLNKLDPKTGTFMHFKPTGNRSGVSYTNIHGLLVDNDELWIGTFEHGLDVMNINSGKVTRHYGMGSGDNALKSNFIYCITKLDGEGIVLGTTRGAYRYNKQSNDFSPLPSMPINNWYTSIAKDEHGIIWAGTYGNGVNYYNTATKQSGNFSYNAADKNSLSSDRVNCIFEDSYKNVWFATEGGLCKLNRDSKNFTRYTTRNGFPSNFIISILEDDAQKLWISTSRGLVSFDPLSQKAKVYTTQNGILNDQFNFNSAFKDRGGYLYFGSVKGLVRFRPDRFVDNNFIPPVYITGIQVFNKDIAIAETGSPLKSSITYTSKITLPHDQSTINIGFAALSYTAPDISEYAYTMEGLDKRWTYLKKNRNAYFTDLSPGVYIFKVKAANSDGVWNDKEAQLIIEILPPWWQTNTAYLIYLLVLTAMIYYAFKYYHRRIEEKNEQRFNVMERAKEKEMFNAKMEFFTNVAHEIKTPLTLIKAPLEKVIKRAEGTADMKNLAIMERNTNRLIDLTNQLLDFRETEIEGFRLNFTEENITDLLQETYNSFRPLAEQKDLLFELKLPREKLSACVDYDAISKILNNLFSNAIKYADRRVRVTLVRFNEQDNLFTIEVKNDGFLIPQEMKNKIFEPFFRLKETEKQKGTGIGLALTRSLVQLHSGTLDLKEPQDHQNVFSLTLPIKQIPLVTNLTIEQPSYTIEQP